MTVTENPYRGGLDERSLIGEIVESYFNGGISREEYRNRLRQAINDMFNWDQQQIEMQIDQEMREEGLID